MRKLFIIAIAALGLAVPAAAGNSTLVVAMRDPGCHWFQSEPSTRSRPSATGPSRWSTAMRRRS